MADADSFNILVRGFTLKERDAIQDAADRNGESMQKLARRAVLKEAGLPYPEAKRRKRAARK